MLLAGLAVHLTGYAAYAMFLGNIDALPPLPDDMLPPVARGTGDPPPPPPSPPVDQKLQEAFGPNCTELQRPLRLWLPDKGFVFAAGEFSIEPDGKVKLAPFSAAVYHKTKGPGKFPEITTLRCAIAILTLDKTVSNFHELNNRKVKVVELRGSPPIGVAITNNRGTQQKGDDLDILVTNGPLIYDERKDLIWTDGVVCLTDFQTKPATVVRGKGMELLLAKETNPNRQRPKTPPAKGHDDSANVEKIILHSYVQMDFWTDGGNGFLGGPQTKKQAAGESQVEKAHIQIHTGGKFVYDLTREFAWFESPPLRDAKGKPNDEFAPNQVHVERRQKVDGRAKLDQLICDRLELQFRKKANSRPADPNAPASSGGGDKEIDTAKAFKRGDGEVVLALDSEGLAAYGNEFFYRAGDANTGPMTVLKGEPLRSVKDGHKMVCKELHLFAANQQGDGQKAWARGPGQIDLLDEKNPEKENRPTHVLWTETLTVVKIKEGGEVFNLMTVEGDASFQDDIQKQELAAEKISVWMLAPNEGEKKVQATGSNKQELRRLVAERNVKAFAPEFIVRKADMLTMTFLPETTRPVAPMLPSTDDGKPAPTPKIPSTSPNATQPMLPKDNNNQPMVAQEKPPEKKDPPIELTGKKITIHISTVGGKKQVEELVAKGNVYVFQPGERPGEKRIDITGQLLTLKNNDERGHTLVVHGDAKTKGRVELNDLVLWGPIVTIDQATNRAEVDGDGAMQMPTNKNLDGTDVAKDKANPRITVYWKKRMTFNGRSADFFGGVQAFQQGSYSKMLCEHLVTYLDRHVSFKGNFQDPKSMKKDNDSQSAKIERIICDKNVFIDDSKVDEAAKALVQRNVIQGWQLVNHQEGHTNITGPGQARQLAKGGGESPLGPQGGVAQPKNEAKPNQQWMLTHVKFPARMFYSADEKSKKATFWADPGNFVEVFHFPTIDINGTMNPDQPPKDGLYLRCENLVVRGEQVKGRVVQTMIARQNVYFRTDTYMGFADIVKYDEHTDHVTMEGANGNPVRLYKYVDGVRRDVSMTSDKVLYNRKTGDVTTTGVKSIQN
jgi:hypothetical protein